MIKKEEERIFGERHKKVLMDILALPSEFENNASARDIPKEIDELHRVWKTIASYDSATYFRSDLQEPGDWEKEHGDSIGISFGMEDRLWSISSGNGMFYFQTSLPNGDSCTDFDTDRKAFEDDFLTHFTAVCAGNSELLAAVEAGKGSIRCLKSTSQVVDESSHDGLKERATFPFEETLAFPEAAGRKCTSKTLLR